MKHLKVLPLVLFFIVLRITWQTISFSRNWHQSFYDFLFTGSSAGRKKLICKPGLLKAAQAVLDGEHLPIPYGNNTSTLWEFKERAPRAKLIRNMDTAKIGTARSATPETYHFTLSSGYAKGRKFMLTFGHGCCIKSRQRAVDIALGFGIFHKARWFNLSDLSPRFREVHHDILKERRGLGYWLWKPYIIVLKTLMSDEMAKGDFLMYQDADGYLLNSPEPLFKLVDESEEGVVVFSNRQTEAKNTKRDAFILMEMDVPGVEQSNQRSGMPFLARKSCSSIQFVMEWIAYLSDRRIASDDPNTMGAPNHPAFFDHRHDQSVLSLLSKKWGIRSFRGTDQYGLYEMGKLQGPYPQIFKLDRLKE